MGVFCTWITDGSVALNGTEGPNNGWLILIVGAFALGWARPLARGSWIAVAGVLGVAVVMGWTALENWLDGRDAMGAAAAYGLLLVLAATVALAWGAISTALSTLREARRRGVT